MADQEVKYTISLKDLFTPKVQDADKAVNRFEGSIGRAQSAAASLATAMGIAFGTAAVVAFGSKMIQAGTTVENALTGLTTLLRDKAEAQQVINNTMEDATKTPFAFEGLLAANKALIGAGVSAQSAREDVLNLANAIAATGGGDDELQRMVVNLQQIRNTGKATALDIKQFAFAGVNIYKVLAEATGKPIEKVKDMEVSYDLLTMALKKAHDEGGMYANGLENMAGNTSVRISNLGDSVFQFSVQLFNDLKPAIDAIITGLADFVSLLRDSWEWVKLNKDIFKALGVGIGVAAGAYALYKGILLAGTVVQYASVAATYIQIAAMYQLGTAYETAGLLTKLLAAAQYGLNAAFAANPIGFVITAIAALAAGVYYAYNHFAKFRAVLWGVWETVKEFGRIVSDIFMGLWHVVHGVFTFDADEIKLGGKQHLDAMFNAGQRLGDAFKKGYEGGMKDFAESQAKEQTVAAPKTATAGKGKTGAGVVNIPTSQTKGAQGQKATTINVTINGGLVKELKVQTTNITEGAARIRELVAQTLLSATNDAQIIGGQ